MSSRIPPTMHPRIPFDLRASAEAALSEDPSRFCGATSRPPGYFWSVKCNREAGHRDPVHVAVGNGVAEWAWEEGPPPRSQEEKAAERTQRLRRLLNNPVMPNSVIDDECRLLLAARHGGDLRAAAWLVRSALASNYRWHLMGVQLWLHAFGQEAGLPLHFRSAEDTCWICALESADCCGDPE